MVKTTFILIFSVLVLVLIIPYVLGLFPLFASSINTVLGVFNSIIDVLTAIISVLLNSPYFMMVFGCLFSVGLILFVINYLRG